MSLTNEQKDIIQSTFAQIPDADQLAIIFYDRLFEIDPSTKPMFRGDMTDQRKKLIQALAVVVHGLGDLSNIVPAIEQLGKRHVAYGVTPDHWNSVGTALLMTLEEVFGEAFTEEVRISWALAYGLIAQTAMAAAYPQVEGVSND